MEELRQEQILQKRQLPKKLKSDHKAQVNELRKAIRNKKTANDKEKFRQLDEQYVKRSQLETELMNEKHERELETLKAELEANMRELQEIQVHTYIIIMSILPYSGLFLRLKLNISQILFLRIEVHLTTPLQ